MSGPPEETDAGSQAANQGPANQDKPEQPARPASRPAKPAPDPQSADAIAEAALRAAQEAIASANIGMQPRSKPDQADTQAQAAQQPAPQASQTPATEPGTPAATGKSSPSTMQMPDFASQSKQTEREPEGIALLDEVNLNVKIELGRTRMLIEDVLRLGEGSVVELDKLAGDPVDVYVNDRHVARGEVLVLSDNFCVRISEIISPTGEDTKARRTG